MIRIVLADDHRMVGMGFRMIIDQQVDMEVVAAASDPEAAFAAVTDLQPDVLVTDISMGTQKSGLLLAERVVASGAACGVVMLTMHVEQEYLRQAMQRGAKGYVLKSSSDEELFAAIRAAAAGETFICRDMLGTFVQEALSGVDSSAGALTPRESEIVSLTVKGYANADIADQLAVSVKTVESQKTKIMTKLGLHSRPELFDYAAAHGLINV